MSNIYIQEPPTSGKVVVNTTVGDIELELWTKEAPKACRNFIQLCMEGYYDNTIFHRVVKGFIVQGGDPTGTGEGGQSIWGQPFKDEFHTRLRFCRRGLLAMANAGKDDNGSQFFFTLGANPELQNKHTIFGKVTGETIYNMLKLEDAIVDENDRPMYPQKILKTEVITNPFKDIEPRVLEPKIEDKARDEKTKKQGVKNFKLLSFGEEAEEDEEETVVFSKQYSGKSKSAHDNLSDPKLSSVTAIETSGASHKRKKGDDSDSEDESEKFEGSAATSEETRNAKERIKNKLKDGKSKANAKGRPVIDDRMETPVEEEEEEEEYYLGKDRADERKRTAEAIRKEIRDFKRGVHNDKRSKEAVAKEATESKEKKLSESDMKKEYRETQEKYKEATAKRPKKGASREDFALTLLRKFQQKLQSARENATVNSSDTSVDGDRKDAKSKDNEDGEIDAEDDANDDSWMTHTLNCEDKTAVLAKDASTKDDDWFEIYDPRNPINKRRRGENQSNRTKNK